MMVKLNRSIVVLVILLAISMTTNWYSSAASASAFQPGSASSHPHHDDAVDRSQFFSNSVDISGPSTMATVYKEHHVNTRGKYVAKVAETDKITTGSLRRKRFVLETIGLVSGIVTIFDFVYNKATESKDTEPTLRDMEKKINSIHNGLANLQDTVPILREMEKKLNSIHNGLADLRGLVLEQHMKTKLYDYERIVRDSLRYSIILKETGSNSTRTKFLETGSRLEGTISAFLDGMLGIGTFGSDILTTIRNATNDDYQRSMESVNVVKELLKTAFGVLAVYYKTLPEDESHVRHWMKAMKLQISKMEIRIQDMEKDLLVGNPNVNQLDKYGYSPLHRLCRYYTHNNLIDIVRILLEKGADINRKALNGWTPLHVLCFYSTHSKLIDIVRLLLEKGADVNSMTVGGQTPLRLLCGGFVRWNTIDIVPLLLEKTADVNSKMPDGWTPLHVLCYYYTHSNLIDIVRLLLEKGVEKDAKTSEGITALMFLKHRFPNGKVKEEIIRLLQSPSEQVFKYFMIKSKLNGMVVDDSSRASYIPGGFVHMHPIHGGVNQFWYLDRETIRAKKTHLCLTSDGGYPKQMTLEQCDPKTRNDQQWRVFNNGTIVNPLNPARCMDIYHAEKRVGGRLTEWWCHGGLNQNYELVF